MAEEARLHVRDQGGYWPLIARLRDKKADLPMHGGNKELGTGLVEKIKKQLGLK